MTEPNLFFVDCADAQGGHRMAFWQWGDARSAHVVLCVHGLTRQGRDFDLLAQALVARAQGDVRVICPDVVGRGESDWLADPTGYQLPLYAADMLALLTQLQADRAIERLDYLGTSMGGLIGLVLAGNTSLALPAPIRRLVLNDVGPTIDAAAIERIGGYLGHVGRFESVQQAADAMWAISQGFGPHTPDEWLALSRPMVVPATWRTPDGSAKRAGDGVDAPFVLHYDPAIALPFRAITPEAAAQGETVMWSLYDAVRAQTLLTRGAQSDLLSHGTALAMTQRGPKARLVEFAGVGHAPTFVKPDQVAAVTSFLLD
ncbi:alpha/beta fold hydrolase [Variovorax sp. ZT4R33]|uniref:alpha/beta fold hydrolase n=1 Tax=Variovorax sp. ZT4R33 TaxID=3443743 RepID=UPI003F46C47F